jgi:tetratricopeptide (TPR) repeat protein
MSGDSLTKIVDAREEAISSVMRSRELDKNESLDLMNKKVLKYLAESYFNDASDIITIHKRESLMEAPIMYNRYKEVIKSIYPDKSFAKKDVEFYLAMSTACRKIHENDKEENDIFRKKSNDYLKKVLEIEPDNYAANYSLSVSYYNQGAYGLEKLPDAKLTDIYEMQSESMRSIEMALPFMLKAYDLKPNKEETVKGLRWMYHNLHRLNKSEEMKQKQLDLRSNQD